MGFRDAGGMALSYILSTVIRFVQFVFALAVCGLYGVDLHAANKQNKYSDGKWIFAEVIGALSAATALVYMIPFILKIPLLFLWDAILFFLWIVLFGIFGNMYIKERAEGSGGITRMKNAVWVDLVNALLWLVTALVMAGYWWKHRHTKTTFTGRAEV